MNPFILTLTMLMLMGMITTSQVRRFCNDALQESLYVNALSRNDLLAEKACVARYEAIKASKPETNVIKKGNPHQKDEASPPRKRASAPLGYNLDRPPNNSRLNLYLALHKDDRVYRDIARRYLVRHFGPEAESILEALIAKKEETREFLFPDDLCTLEIPESLREIFYSWMPSFLHLTSFDGKLTYETRRVNVLFASEGFLEVVVGSAEAAQSIVAIREAMWERIEHEEDINRTMIKTDLRTSCAQIVPDQILRLLDFSLGKPGNAIFMTDSSGVTVREKVAIHLALGASG